MKRVEVEEGGFETRDGSLRCENDEWIPLISLSGYKYKNPSVSLSVGYQAGGWTQNRAGKEGSHEGDTAEGLKLPRDHRSLLIQYTTGGKRRWIGVTRGLTEGLETATIHVLQKTSPADPMTDEHRWGSEGEPGESY